MEKIALIPSHTLPSPKNKKSYSLYCVVLMTLITVFLLRGVVLNLLAIV